MQWLYLHLWLVSETQLSNHLWEKPVWSETTFLRSPLETDLNRCHGSCEQNRAGLLSALEACSDKVRLAGGLLLWATEFHYVPNLSIACTLASYITVLFSQLFAKYVWSVNVQGALKVWHVIAHSFSWQKHDLHWWLQMVPSLIPGMALGQLSCMWPFFSFCLSVTPSHLSVLIS